MTFREVYLTIFSMLLLTFGFLMLIDAATYIITNEGMALVNLAGIVGGASTIFCGIIALPT